MKLTIRGASSVATSTHEKSWGTELWVENCPDYCGKILRIEPGKYTSMHFHLKKLETMYVVRGDLKLQLTDPETGEYYELSMAQGQWVQIPRGQPHRLLAGFEKGATVVEFSTEHEDSDSYRISPSYKEQK